MKTATKSLKTQKSNEINFKEKASIYILLGKKYNQVNMRSVYPITLADKIVIHGMFRESKYNGNTIMTAADLPLVEKYISIHSKKHLEEIKRQKSSKNKPVYIIDRKSFLDVLRTIRFYLEGRKQIFIF